MIFFQYKDKDTEKAYNLWRRSAQLKQIKLISFITASLYLILSLLDYSIAPKEILSSMLVLHLIILPLFGYSITFLALSNKNYSLMISFLILASISATIGHTFIMINLNYYSSYVPEIYLIIFWVFAVSGLPLHHATYTTLSMIAISGFGAFHTIGLQTYDLVMHFFWMIASFSFGFTGAYLLESSYRTIFSQQKELHQEINNKNILLKELAHRVKNNLQIVSSILYSQSKKVNSEETKKIFEESIQTVKAMGMIHENLFASKDLDSIDFKEYIQNLISLATQNMYNKQVIFSFDSQSIIISIQCGVPLGLIVNEILTNSLKYALPKENKEVLIKISIIMDENEEIHLHISDNGEGINFEKQQKGFGTQLIHSLVLYQLKGEIEAFNNNGLNYEIKFYDVKSFETLPKNR
ncbi:MAG: sensor histidine kinase [Arcobacteraceae bacterium]|jgi:two-component sensor histidine kinase|nr:sensor histidine kinase [Arcobacteraceae bacterium]